MPYVFIYKKYKNSVLHGKVMSITVYKITPPFFPVGKREKLNNLPCKDLYHIKQLQLRKSDFVLFTACLYMYNQIHKGHLLNESFSSD